MEQLYGIVKEARALLKSVPKSAANPKTLADYSAKAARLRAHAKDPDDFAELLSIARETTKLSTWYARRAPLMMMARGGLEHYMAEQDRIQRQLKTAGIPENSEQWGKYRTAVDCVSRWQARLSLVIDSLPPSVVARRKSKRVALKGLPADWRQVIIKRTPKYHPATLVAAVTGCRPDELVTGVRMTIEGGQLVAMIAGSKSTEKTGQPWRKLAWPVDSESDLVRDLCATVHARGGELLVQIDSGKKFHGAVRAAGKREWPSRKNDVTPYCFRHQAAADMKASGALSSGDISAALGHLSDITKSTYGHANMGRAGSVAPVSVAAARPVKVKASSVLAQQMTKKINAKSSGLRPEKTGK